MKIFNFDQYITESVINDTPEEVISQALNLVKRNIEKMFTNQDEEILNFGETKNKERKDNGGMSLSDLGLELQSIEISKYSKVNDSLKVIFSDEHNRYDLIILIDLASALPSESDKSFNMNDIENSTVKFKKYTDDELIGQFTKLVPIKDINEELLIELKIELDDMFGNDQDDFNLEIE